MNAVMEAEKILEGEIELDMIELAQIALAYKQREAGRLKPGDDLLKRVLLKVIDAHAPGLYDQALASLN